LTHQELELWAQNIISDVLKNQRAEDSRVELKSSWPEPDKAAIGLAAHANAARGTPILWLIGIDEKAQRVSIPDTVELANWFKSVERFFDGDAPRMLLDANVRSGGGTVVALYFETHQGAPFVVKNPGGGYPQFVVPWREGTSKRAASRYDLLRILIPIRRLSALVEELNFNVEVANATPLIASLGALFRDDEFHQVLRDGALSTLPAKSGKAITDAYISMKRANHLVTAALAVPSQHQQPAQLESAWTAVCGCRELIEVARAGLLQL
jgi:hypothetical protein